MPEKPDAEKAALLAAIANAGSAAQAAATSRADQIQAPRGFYEEQASQIAAPYSQASQDAAASRAATAAYTGGISSIGKDYSSRVKQAYPVYDRIIQAQARQRDEEEESERLQRQFDLEDRQFLREDRAAARAEKDALNASNQATARQEQEALDDYNNQQQFLQNLSRQPISARTQASIIEAISLGGDDYTSAASAINQSITDSTDPGVKRELESAKPYLQQYYFPRGRALAGIQLPQAAPDAPRPRASAPARRPRPSPGQGFRQGAQRSLSNLIRRTLRIG